MGVNLNYKRLEQARRDVQAAATAAETPRRRPPAYASTRTPEPRLCPGAIGKEPARFVELVREVEARHSLPPGEIYFVSNIARYVAARREAFRLLREQGLSYSGIGRMFGMNHSTVIHHVRKGKTMSAAAAEFEFGEIVGFDLRQKVVMVAHGKMSAGGPPIINVIPMTDDQIAAMRRQLREILWPARAGSLTPRSRTP